MRDKIGRNAGFGFPGRRPSRDDQVAIAVEDLVDRLYLDGAELVHFIRYRAS